MNVYVTNCKDNMIECVQSFFSFCIFAAQGCQCPGKWKSTQYPPIFLNELVQQRIYFTEKKTYQRILKETHKKTSNLPVGGEMCVLYTGQFFLAWAVTYA